MAGGDKILERPHKRKVQLPAQTSVPPQVQAAPQQNSMQPVKKKSGSQHYWDDFFGRSTVTPTNSVRSDLRPPEQQGNAGGWKMGVSTSHKIAAQMAADANLSYKERQAIKEQEAERFKKGHTHNRFMAKLRSFFMKDKKKALYKGIDPYKIYSDDRYYRIMNSLARTGKAPDELDGKPVTPEEIEIAKQAQEAISNDMARGKHSRLETGRTVYRGAGVNYTDIMRNQLNIEDGLSDEELNQRLLGGILYDKALTSTTLKPRVADGFAKRNGKEGDRTMMQIYAPQGLGAQYIAPISLFENEEEMLVNNNTPMRIFDVNTSRNEEGKTFRLMRAAYLRGLIGGHRMNKPNAGGA